MKLVKQEPVFVPIAIRIETPEELALMRAVFGMMSHHIESKFGVASTYPLYSELRRMDQSAPRLSLHTPNFKE